MSMDKRIVIIEPDGLNPCCNGIYSMSHLVLTSLFVGLNPCCNGIYSMREKKNVVEQLLKVLIRVVMEYTQ